MGDLAVSVRLFGALVEDRVIDVERVVRLGEAEGAEVSFPGADLAVVRLGGRLSVRGRALEEGDELRIALGSVEVLLEHTMKSRLPSEWAGLMDGRLFATVMMTIAGLSYLDAASAWWGRQGLEGAPLADRWARALRGRAEGSGADAAQASAIQTSELPAEGAAALAFLSVDGPRHEPDERPSSLAWHRWYRAGVPDDSAQVLAARDRLAEDAADPVARRVLAGAAYNSDQFEQAVEHYTWIVQRWPADRDALLRLGWAWQRLGRHRAEITVYKQILRMEPTNCAAMAGLAVAQARLNQLDAAAHSVEELVAIAPDAPATALALAKVDALRGRHEESLETLERALAGRAGLSAEMQVDLRRDLALDPAFSPFRGDRRLLSLLHRQLGAAAPRLLGGGAPGGAPR